VRSGKLLYQRLKPPKAIGHSRKQGDALSPSFKQEHLFFTAEVLNVEYRLINNDTGDLGQERLEPQRGTSGIDRVGFGLAPELGDLAYHCRLYSVVLDQNPAMPKRG
jgi:hypothetical protein